MTRRPRWLPLVAATAAFALFVSLGTWQLQRAGERAEEVEAIGAAEEQPPLPLPADDVIPALAWQFVALEGRFMPARQFLLDNRTLDGDTGFVVLTPFRLHDGRVVLVDRGWVVADGREPADSIQLPPAAESVTTVIGRLWLAESGFSIGPALADTGNGWPRTTTRVDYAALGDALGHELVPAIVRLEADLPWRLRARPVEPGFGPERHLGYAFQWYALAATVLIVTLALLFRMRRRRLHD